MRAAAKSRRSGVPDHLLPIFLIIQLRSHASPHRAYRATRRRVGAIRGHWLAVHHRLRHRRVKWNPTNDLDSVFAAIHFDLRRAVGIHVRFVDAHERRDAKMRGCLKRALHIMNARDRRLGHDHRHGQGDRREGKLEPLRVRDRGAAGAGGEGALDASNFLKPSLARGELQVIGATTLTEYRKYIEKDPALERRFQPVLVPEPTEEQGIKMLKAIRDKYEAFHRVKIPDEAIESAVKLSKRYVGDRFLPDKAVDLIDEAASAVRLPLISLPEEIRSLEERISQWKQEAQEAELYEQIGRLKVELEWPKNTARYC